jgi:hypothetical protein
MKKTLVIIVIGLLLKLNTSCYNPDDQYTLIKDIILEMESPEGLYADSATIHKVDIKLPGLKFDKNMDVTLKTDWGTWSNDSSVITLSVPYEPNSGNYHLIEFLKPSRKVAPFNILVSSNSNNLISYFNFNSIARYPNKVQILSDSLTLKRKPGNSTTAKAYFFSSIGYPSYGFRFSFIANDDVSISPLEHHYESPGYIMANLLITNKTKQNTLVLSGKLLDLNEQPEFLPIEIELKP